MSIEAAVEAVRSGRLIVMPTDTVYGIGTRPDARDATGRLFDAKGRPRDLQLPILVASVRDAESAGVFDHRARRLAETFWPGALTIVVPRSTLAARWDLGGDGATVGIRLPAHPLARAVLAGTGPMAVTSANPSGEAPLSSCDELEAAFGDAVAVYLCEEGPLRGRASTVVDLAHGEPRVLRAGGIAESEVRRSLA